ncbi:MAG TPA: hypothetical protein VGQ19_12720 [Burkholderiales bacterium]|jgi:hypothetical protein|nr:hypothetical protein [Burkholderiales bacterium]
MAHEYWMRLRNMHRYQGLRSLMWHVAVKCAAPLGRIELAFLYEMPLTRPVEITRARVNATVTPATRADVAELAVVFAQSEDAPPERIPAITQAIGRRLDSGEICFIARVGPQIVHYNWISFRWKESLADRFIVLAEDAAYCGGAYTVESWRGQAIHTEVNSMMLRFLYERGFRRAYTFVNGDNRSSRKTMNRLGWKRSGVMVTFKARREKRARIWLLKGTLDPFVAERIPQ